MQRFNGKDKLYPSFGHNEILKLVKPKNSVPYNVLQSSPNQM